MLNKWEKISSIIKFTIDHIDVHTDTFALFDLTWKQGDLKGTTTKMPQNNHTIPFHASIQCPCTIHLNKADNEIQPKDLKFKLRIFKDSTPKIYGKLTINVSPYFGISEPFHLSLEMESCHTVPPKLHGSFIVIRNGVDPSSDKSFSHSHNSKKSDKNISSKPINSHPYIFHNDSVQQQHNIIKISKHKKSSNPNQNSMENPNIRMLFQVLSHVWSVALAPNFLDSQKSYPFPYSVFPIFSAIINSHILDKKGPSFQSLFEKIFLALNDAPLQEPCPIETRFMSYLVIYLLVYNFSNEFNFDSNRVDTFLNGVFELVEASFLVFSDEIIELTGANNISNQIASSSFDVENLVNDFKLCIKKIKDIVKMPNLQMKRMCIKNIIEIIDIRTVTKILTFPKRISFHNAINWSSFTTAIEPACGTSFVFLHEISSLIMMAQKIVDDFSLKNEFCPHLTPKTTIFILDNIQTDEILLEPVDWKKFGARYGIFSEISPDEIKSSITPECYQKLAETIKIKDWDNCEYDSHVIHDFPFIEDYMKKLY